MIKDSLIIITPKTYDGGAENVAARLSRHFSNSHEVSVISFDCSRRDYEYSGKVLDLKLTKEVGLVKRLIVIMKAVFKISHHKKLIKPTASISLIGYPNLTNVLSRKGELCIVSVRTYIRRSPSIIKHTIQKFFFNKVYNRADKVVAICEGVRKDLIEYYGVDATKVKVIYPYFDVAKIQKKSLEPVEAGWREIFKKPVIITAGRLTYDKGQWHLIKAFALVKAEIHNAVLVILGRGEMEDDLKKLAERTGYGSDIHFMGYRDNPFKYIRMAKVFAFPSLIEGFGNALGESLACGTPAVAADCDVGPREILAPESDPHLKANSIEAYPAGFLIPAFDDHCDLQSIKPVLSERHMANALLYILQDNALRGKMSKAAKMRAMYFDTSKVTEEWDALLSFDKIKI